MTEIQDYQKALINADRAGDAEAARILAQKLDALQAEEDFSLLETAKNIPSSAVQFGKDMATPFIHPVDTAKNIYNLVLGVASKAIPGEQPSEAYADQVAEFVKGRYGSWDKFKKTVERDPVGVLSDVSVLFTGGATAATKVGPVTKSLTRIGKAIDPVNLTLKTGAKAAGKVPGVKQGARTLYKSAAKFGTSSKTDVNKITETALREGLMPTDKGIGKLLRTKKEIGQRIGEIVDTATESGAKIPVDDIFKNLDDLKKELSGFKIHANKDVTKLNKIVDDFKKYLDDNNIKEVTPKQLQDFKTDAYKRLNYDASMFQGDYVGEMAGKNMASAARERLEGFSPELKKLNERYGDLSELEPFLERSAKRIEGRDVLGLGTSMKAGAGGIAGGPGGAAVGAGIGLLDAPRTKARGALALEGMRNTKFLENKTGPYVARQGLLQSGRLDRETKKKVKKYQFAATKMKPAKFIDKYVTDPLALEALRGTKKYRQIKSAYLKRLEEDPDTPTVWLEQISQ